jgi:hypothetical protein
MHISTGLCIMFVFQPIKSSSPKTSERSVGENKDTYFFDVPTFLTVSGQLHLEVINGSVKRPFCVLLASHNIQLVETSLLLSSHNIQLVETGQADYLDFFSFFFCKLQLTWQCAVDEDHFSRAEFFSIRHLNFTIFQSEYYNG